MRRSAIDATEAAPERRVWAIAIFAAREAPASLSATIAAALAASAARKDTVIDVLVNGNPNLAAAAAAHARSAHAGAEGPLLRVWSIALGDKSHTWNEYVHRIWPGSELAFFVDGYARLRPKAIDLLSQGVLSSATALGGTGVPSIGRSLASTRSRMTTEGGIHGNAYCIRRSVIEHFRSTGFKLPLGLYRTDPLVGAVIAYRLNPALHGWDLKNTIHVESAATWDIDKKRWWRLADIRATIKRLGRQAQGEFENLAIRDHLTIRKQLPEDIPATAAQLVLGWAANNPEAAAQACRRNRRAAQALDSFREPQDWREGETAPALLFNSQSIMALTNWPAATDI